MSLLLPTESKTRVLAMIESIAREALYHRITRPELERLTEHFAHLQRMPELMISIRLETFPETKETRIGLYLAPPEKLPETLS